VEYKIGDLFAVAGMANANTQAQKVIATHLRHDVAQTIMTAMTTTLLEANSAGQQVKLIVNDKRIRQRDFIKIGQGSNRLTTTIHVGIGFEQPELLAADVDLGNITEKLTFGTKRLPLTASYRIHKPKAGVVPGLLILGARISQPHN
jgi:hypothetical protein